jgi:hypothetical protein
MTATKMVASSIHDKPQNANQKSKMPSAAVVQEVEGRASRIPNRKSKI